MPRCKPLGWIYHKRIWKEEVLVTKEAARHPTRGCRHRCPGRYLA
jgi:hypothetical protein